MGELIEDAVKDEESVDAASGHDPSKKKRKREKVTGTMLLKDLTPTEAEKLLNTPYSEREQSGGGSKTIYVENIPFFVDENQIHSFFRSAGEIVYVSLPPGEYPDCLGFAYVEFTTAKEAEMALKLNGEKLLGLKVTIRLLKESQNRDSQSLERDPAQENTAVIKGFNKNGGEDLVRRALVKRFGSCGEITRVCIWKNKREVSKGKHSLSLRIAIP